MHYGIFGMKWGVRRYQNKDGSLTPEGYKHYGYKSNEWARKADKAITDTIEGKNDKKIGNFMRKLDSIIVNTLEGKNTDKIRDFVTKAGQVAEDAVTGKNNVINKLDDDIIGKDTAEARAKEERMAPVLNAEYRHALDKGTDGVIDWYYYSDNNGTVAVIDRQMGKNSVRFHANFNPLQSEKPPEDAAMSVNDAVDRYVKEYKKVESTVSEELAKAYYDSGAFKKWDSEWSNVDRNKFKDLVVKRLGEIDLDANGEEPSNSIIWFNGIDNDYYSQFYGDDLFGNNFVSVEYDIINDIAYDPELHKGG